PQSVTGDGGQSDGGGESSRLPVFWGRCCLNVPFRETTRSRGHHKIDKVDRYLVLFAREPARQARDKGLSPGAARDLFLGFARGWAAAARLSRARLVIATPPEDRPAWERALDGACQPIWIFQRGRCLGVRLEDSARQATALGGHAVLVGGDVPPSAAALL